MNTNQENNSKEQWFSYDPNDRFILHDTEDKARTAAKQALEYYRDKASDEGWNKDVTKVCWGKVSQRVEQTSLKHRPPPEEIDDDGYDKDETDWDHAFDEIAEYELRPELPDLHPQIIEIRKADSKNP